MADGKEWVLFLIATVWAGDISAFFSGTFFGRHKLYPKISPNKTYEGLVGAIVGSVIVALVFACAVHPLFRKGTLYPAGHRIGNLRPVGGFHRVDVEAKCSGEGFGVSHPGPWGDAGSPGQFPLLRPFSSLLPPLSLEGDPMKRLAILGSTGSIGVNTLDIVRQFPERFKVIGLSAGLNIQLLKQQILQFRPKVVSVLNKELSEALRRELPRHPVEIVHGVEGLIRVATHPEVDQVVSAIVGAVGLIPTLSAIKTGKTIALANKEPLVMAGKIVMEEAKTEPGSDLAGGQRTQRHLSSHCSATRRRMSIASSSPHREDLSSIFPFPDSRR